MLEMSLKGLMIKKQEFPQKEDSPRPSKKQKQNRKRKGATQAKKSNKRSATFEDTPLGYFLMTRCPLEYKLLIESVRKKKINANLIEAFVYTSDNEAFRTLAFRKALIDYRRYGKRTPNKVVFNVDKVVELIRENVKLG